MLRLPSSVYMPRSNAHYLSGQDVTKRPSKAHWARVVSTIESHEQQTRPKSKKPKCQNRLFFDKKKSDESKEQDKDKV